jgi:hypothetical protein
MPALQEAPAAVATTYHCPHCLCVLGTAEDARPQPRQAMRCPHCRLLVAAARGVDAVTAAEQRATGSAANVLGSAARRQEGTVRSPDEIAAALREAASKLSCPVERLRMLDYDELQRAGSASISVADVLATHRTWKHACRLAATAPAAAA